MASRTNDADYGEALRELDPTSISGGLINCYDALSSESNTALSVTFGLIGLGVALTFLGLLGGIGVFLWFETPTFQNATPFGNLILMQVIYFPLAAGEGVLLFAVLFWGAPLPVRILVAAILGSLGFGAFLGMFHLLSSHSFNDVAYGFWDAMFSFTVCVAAFAIVVQLVSRWSLNHWSAGQVRGRRTTTRAMMEVTGLAALTYALINVLNKQGVELYDLGAAVMGMAFATCAMAACFGTLGRQIQMNRRILWLTLMISLGWIGSLFMCVMQMREQFGMTVGKHDFVDLALVSLIGTFLISAIATLDFVWLRFCGWKCSRN